jgi:MerR family transcriptional regulator, thiopeptide resistance regulator
MTLFTVSQIAQRTGMSVRTLHHYEAKNLLAPACRSDAGYRLYGEGELKRLQHIVSLKALGFSLAQIRACLDADSPSLHQALTSQIGRLRETVVRQQDLLARLEHVAQQAARGETIDAETLLASIEATNVMEKYFTTEQMQSIKRRGDELGPERIQAVEQAWPQVIAGMQAALQLEKDPACAEVQALARRWRSLVREFTAGDSGIQHSLGEVYKREPGVQAKTGIDPDLMDYACRAMKLIDD